MLQLLSFSNEPVVWGRRWKQYNMMCSMFCIVYSKEQVFNIWHQMWMALPPSDMNFLTSMYFDTIMHIMFTKFIMTSSWHLYKKLMYFEEEILAYKIDS